jgi:hypothetical protein
MAKRKSTKGQTQRSTKHAHKTKDRVTRTLLKAGGELMCSGRVGSSFPTSGTLCVNLVTNTMISHEWGKDMASFYLILTYINSISYRWCYHWKGEGNTLWNNKPRSIIWNFQSVNNRWSLICYGYFNHATRGNFRRKYKWNVYCKTYLSFSYFVSFDKL